MSHTSSTHDRSQEIDQLTWVCAMPSSPGIRPVVRTKCDFREWISYIGRSVQKNPRNRHILTVHSYGVLRNTKRGGLRRDLSQSAKGRVSDGLWRSKLTRSRQVVFARRRTAFFPNGRLHIFNDWMESRRFARPSCSLINLQ
jgi:hypothetical protein